MTHTRQQGFTVIELLLISVIVGILATLVALTHSGVQAKNRNAERKASIDSLQSYMETYYAETSKYPSLANLNTASWRTEHTADMPAKLIRDPQWNDKNTDCTIKGASVLASTPAAGCYAYQVTAADGSPCEDPAVACAQYSMTATFEGGEKYVKASLN